MRIVAIIAGLAVLALCQEQLLDRLAVVVGKDAITETEILDEIRITTLLNGEPADFSPKSRKEAAERLVDQLLIREDIKAANYPEPENTESDRMLAELRKQRFRGDAEYRQALERYGVTEQQLKAHLLWQLTALRFTDYRFRPGVPQPGEALRRHLEEETKDRAEVQTAQKPAANGVKPHANANGVKPAETRPEKPPPGERALPHTVDKQMAQWLEQARARVRIEFRDEVFQ